MGDDIDGDAKNDKFGTSVSLSSDGSIVAIGAPYDDDGLSAGSACMSTPIVHGPNWRRH